AAARYFSDELTAVNLVASVGPMACTVTTITRAMPDAIRQYSIAVAPDWSDRNLAIRRRIKTSSLKAADSSAPDTTWKLGPISCEEVDQQAEQRVKIGAETHGLKNAGSLSALSSVSTMSAAPWSSRCS